MENRNVKNTPFWTVAPCSWEKARRDNYKPNLGTFSFEICKITVLEVCNGHTQLSHNEFAEQQVCIMRVPKLACGSRSSIVGWGTMLQAEWSRVRDSTRGLNFSNLPNPSSRTRPGVYSVFKINEYQKQKKMFLGSRARPVCVADNITTICEPIV
jgi:hypothetical protein